MWAKSAETHDWGMIINGRRLDKLSWAEDYTFLATSNKHIIAIRKTASTRTIAITA